MKKAEMYRPTVSELEILQIIWDNGPSTVRFVNDKLNEQKKTGYTTTLKLMQIMLEKNLLGRNEKTRVHIYHPVVQKEEIQNQLLDRLLENAFSGSAHRLVMQVLGNHKPSRSELEEIKKLIKDLEKNDNGTAE
jgi:BlaI family penicillinase repressor